MRGSLEMPELVSKLKTSVVVVERATGELLRTIPRKEMKLLTIHLLRKPQSVEKLLLREKLRRMPLLKTRIKVGDTATIGECRPLSKTVRFNMLKITKAQ